MTVLAVHRRPAEQNALEAASGLLRHYFIDVIEPISELKNRKKFEPTSIALPAVFDACGHTYPGTRPITRKT